MKAFLCLPVAILAVSLTGCATSPGLAANDSSESKYDTEYMARVEHASRGRGVTVKWMNPPEKKKQPEQARDD